MTVSFDELKTSNPDFVEGIRVAQIAANSGWKIPPTDFVDRRVFSCPVCSSPGLNTCWGVVSYTCGASYLADGEEDEPCPSTTVCIGE